MRRIRVAVCGTFDLENYGDLLFPAVFAAAMRSRGIDLEMIELAPTATKPRTTAADRVVASLTDIEAVHAERPIDALVVGGGALVQWRHIEQALNGTETLEDYLIHDTWVVPALFSTKYAVPLFWNAPDVPHVFPADIAHVVRFLVNAASYLSVRNPSSRSNLEQLGIPASQITQTWDTALSLRENFYSEHPVAQLGVPSDPYIVVHINRYLGDSEVAEFGALISAYCAAHDVIPVLMPLSNTHLDSTGLRSLQTAIGDAAVLIDPAHIGEMASVIAGAQLYVGVSYHGVVTALAMGVPAIGYNYMLFGKTRDLFADVGSSDRYAENLDDLRTLMLEGGFEKTATPSLDTAIASINSHFDRLAAELSAIATTNPPPAALVSDRPVELDRAFVASTFRQSEQLIVLKEWIEGNDRHTYLQELAERDELDRLSARLASLEKFSGVSFARRVKRRLSR